MSNDWKPGDLALCVEGGRPSVFSREVEWPKAGRVYTVESVGSKPFITGMLPALTLRDGPPNVRGNRCWPATRFRKIHPHTPDEQDAETIRLLNGVKEPVS